MRLSSKYNTKIQRIENAMRASTGTTKMAGGVSAAQQPYAGGIISDSTNNWKVPLMSKVASREIGRHCDQDRDFLSSKVITITSWPLSPPRTCVLWTALSLDTRARQSFLQPSLLQMPPSRSLTRRRRDPPFLRKACACVIHHWSFSVDHPY